MTLREKWLPILEEWEKECWANTGKLRWNPDWKTIDAVASFMGLTRELQVLPMWKAALSGLGCYNCEDEFIHRIYIAEELHPLGASVCLWHELTHAKQAEAYKNNREFWDKVSPVYTAVTQGSEEYFNLPIEIEAFESADYHWTIGPLVSWPE